MARIDDIFKSETKKAEQHPKRITKWIHYTKLHDNDAQYCNERNKEEIEALADLIEADGEVLQDLLVKKTDTDEYTIIAGHKRRRACKLLVEERGREEFALVPCVIKNLSEVRAEFQVYSSNGYHEKTEYEKMHELERMKYLLENYPEEFPQAGSGRMVERLAKLLNMNKTTVGEYLTISANLGEAGMKKFESGEMKKSAAVAMSSLPTKTQDSLIEQGIITHKDIKDFKKSEEDISVKESLTVSKETVPKAELEEKKEVKLEIRDGELPPMKNAEERKAFLDSFHEWTIWFEVPEASEKYYRFNLSDESCIVVCEYETYLDWSRRTVKMQEYYLLNPGYHYLHDCSANRTQIIEHLKNLQK